MQAPDTVDQIEALIGGLPTHSAGQVAGIRRWEGEFWTSRQRQASRLHEISYRACFKAQLPEFFIHRLSRPDDLVYDPFMGRGTTPLQAALMGRIPVGNDINPLSLMLLRPRLAPPDSADIDRRLAQIPWDAEASVTGEPLADLAAFYHPQTLRQLLALRHWLRERECSGAFDALDDWIRMVAISRLSGHSSGFFSVYTLPPNQAVSAAAQRKINARRRQQPPPRDVRQLIRKKSLQLLTAPAPEFSGQHYLFSGPAWHTPELDRASVSLIVCSPPFLDVVNYADDNWLRGWFAGIDLQRVEISIHRRLPEWVFFIQRCFKEFARVVRPGGWVAFEVGEVRRASVELEHHVVQALAGLPFSIAGILVNRQKFSKTANCWGVANNSRGTNSNRIVLAVRSP